MLLPNTGIVIKQRCLQLLVRYLGDAIILPDECIIQHHDIVFSRIDEWSALIQQRNVKQHIRSF